MATLCITSRHLFFIWKIKLVFPAITPFYQKMEAQNNILMKVSSNCSAEDFLFVQTQMMISGFKCLYHEESFIFRGQSLMYYILNLSSNWGKSFVLNKLAF